jgi:oxygen-independent coproporphyrinogen-3 oxidase
MLGLYFHIPFCVQKCTYCDFVSVAEREREDAYVRALLREIRMTGRFYREPVNTIFFGGGTPSMIRAEHIAKIMDTVRGNFTLVDDAEITIECNPCSVSKEKLYLYKKQGVNRLSIGLQAVQARLLTLLGRDHTTSQFDEAFENARSGGFSNINIDLIYALPGQTMDDWQETLLHALCRRPEHISVYALKIEAGTTMEKWLKEGKIAAPDEDLDADMYEAAQVMLAEMGYENYEISNFALPGRVCKHNLKYWNLRNYLGLGAAAHSCIGQLRFSNTSNVEQYIEMIQRGSFCYVVSEFIGDKERKKEYLMLKMRLQKGFSLSEYRRLFKEDFLQVCGQGIARAERQGLSYLAMKKVTGIYWAVSCATRMPYRAL